MNDGLGDRCNEMPTVPRARYHDKKEYLTALGILTIQILGIKNGNDVTSVTRSKISVPSNPRLRVHT